MRLILFAEVVVMFGITGRYGYYFINNALGDDYIMQCSIAFVGLLSTLFLWFRQVHLSKPTQIIILVFNTVILAWSFYALPHIIFQTPT